MSTVRVGFHVIVGQRFTTYGTPDGKPAVRVAKNRPACAPHEVAVFVQLDLPKSLFLRPALRAQITVPESEAPLVITPQVQHDIARVVSEQLGIVLNVSAPIAQDSGVGNE